MKGASISAAVPKDTASTVPGADLELLDGKIMHHTSAQQDKGLKENRLNFREKDQ